MPGGRLGLRGEIPNIMSTLYEAQHFHNKCQNQWNSLGVIFLFYFLLWDWTAFVQQLAKQAHKTMMGWNGKLFGAPAKRSEVVLNTHFQPTATVYNSCKAFPILEYKTAIDNIKFGNIFISDLQKCFTEYIN